MTLDPTRRGKVGVLRLQIAGTGDADVALDGKLIRLARAPVEALRGSATTDRNPEESAQDGLGARVNRLLARYDCPAEKKERTVELVLEQPVLFSEAA